MVLVWFNIVLLILLILSEFLFSNSWYTQANASVKKDKCMPVRIAVRRLKHGYISRSLKHTCQLETINSNSVYQEIKLLISNAESKSQNSFNSMLVLGLLFWFYSMLYFTHDIPKGLWSLFYRDSMFACLYVLKLNLWKAHFTTYFLLKNIKLQ